MKVLSINGSPRKNSNSQIIANAVLRGAKTAGAQVSNINLKDLKVNGCISCMYCRENEGCSQKDDMQKIYKQINDADAVVINFPIYMFTMNGQTKLMLDRLFPYLGSDFKPRVNKKTVLCIAQGNSDKEAFKQCIEWSKNVFGFIGFPVRDVLLGTDGNAPGCFADKKDLLAQAEETGKRLASK